MTKDPGKITVFSIDRERIRELIRQVANDCNSAIEPVDEDMLVEKVGDAFTEEVMKAVGDYNHLLLNVTSDVLDEYGYIDSKEC